MYVQNYVQTNRPTASAEDKSGEWTPKPMRYVGLSEGEAARARLRAGETAGETASAVGIGLTRGRGVGLG